MARRGTETNPEPCACLNSATVARWMLLSSGLPNSFTLSRTKEQSKMRKTLLLMLLVSTCAVAQNPVSDALRNMLTGRAKNTIAAAETMPAEKYSYKPTEAQVPYGHWVSHATQANYLLCGKLTDD